MVEGICVYRIRRAAQRPLGAKVVFPAVLISAPALSNYFHRGVCNQSTFRTYMNMC